MALKDIANLSPEEINRLEWKLVAKYMEDAQSLIVKLQGVEDRGLRLATDIAKDRGEGK